MVLLYTIVYCTFKKTKDIRKLSKTNEIKTEIKKYQPKITKTNLQLEKNMKSNVSLLLKLT